VALNKKTVSMEYNANVVSEVTTVRLLRGRPVTLA